MIRSIKILLILAVTTTIFSSNLSAQEPKIFRTGDFELHGNVKSCLVLTDYGEEEFAFDTIGRLTKWETRYNDTDYDVTYYRYQKGQLKERRDERYRDGVFDKQTSMAHFYTLDSTKVKRLTETIFSYNEELLDQFQYIYDTSGKLKQIIHANEKGIDETTVERSTYKNEHTVKYELNGVVERSVRENQLITKEGDTLKVILEKDFVDGVGLKASEKKYNTRGQLIEEQQYAYDKSENSFQAKALLTYFYDDRGFLQKIITKNGPALTETEYVYQFDDEVGGNWVKKITLPDNSYVTRKITYYPSEKKVVAQPE